MSIFKNFPGLMALPCLFMAFSVAAVELPQIIHGQAAISENGSGQVFVVESGLCQLRVNETLVAAATKGTVFEIYPPLLANGRNTLHVLRGNVVVIDEATNRAGRVSEGGRLLFSAGGKVSKTTEYAIPLDHAQEQWQQQERQQSFMTSDYIMVRQQEYLSSLVVNVVDLNVMIGRFILQLVPRKH